MDNSISFSKIVATPTLNSWAQAYNAGKLFAVISLEKTQGVVQDLESLNMFGKNLLEKLEQEFFTLEDKNLESIKKAINNTFEKTLEGINISFASGVFINDILYLFSKGHGKIFIKRNGNFGLVLDSKDDKDIVSSSGFIKNNDYIVLATSAFSEVIPNNDLKFFLNDSLPSEISESLAPKIHKAENGKISAIIIKYVNPQIIEDAIGANGTDEIPLRSAEQNFEGQAEDANQEKKSPHPLNKYLLLLKSRLKKLKVKIRPTKTVFLSIALIIVLFLILSIFYALQNQNNAKAKALFAQIYPEAQKKYEEGQSLLDLNKNLARDSFLVSQKILKDNKDEFPEKSKEAVQIQDLLKKVESGLAKASPVDESGLDRSKLSITVTNGSGTEGVAGKAANILKEIGYNVVSTGNADNYNYKGVTIKVKKEKSNFLDLLKKDLLKDYKISASSSDLSSDSPSDALIIIGK